MMPIWVDAPHPQDVVFDDDRLGDILRSRWSTPYDHEPLVVINHQHQLLGVVGLSDIFAYMANQMDIVHHLWPALTVVVPQTSWSALRTAVLLIPIGQLPRSRRGIVAMPTDWAHAVRLLSRSARSTLYVQNRQHTLVGKITWTSLQQQWNLLDELEEEYP